MRGVVANGGMGDVVMALSMLRRLPEHLGKFKIFTHYPEVYEFFTGKKAHGMKGIAWQDLISRKWESLIILDHFAYFKAAKPEGPHLKLLENTTKFVREHGLRDFLNMHPHYDGVATDQLMPKGFKRWTLPQHMLGLEVLPLDHKEVKPLKFWCKDYITLSVGVGNVHAGHVTRPTKSWDYTFAAEFVELVKKKYKKLKVVQLGTFETSPRIPGVDACFLSLNLEQSYRILAGSRLHVDGDSGLVHAATAFGVKCAVIFGPTPAQYFGYPENINIEVELPCKPCWWSTDTWVSQCPQGYRAPMCMNMVFPKMVMERIEPYL